jgi:hypothetical protein
MLVLRARISSSAQQTLKVAFDFLGLPDWELETWEIIPEKRNKGGCEEGMDPATRRRLEEYFEPHNRRLYDFLGKDLGVVEVQARARTHQRFKRFIYPSA